MKPSLKSVLLTILIFPLISYAGLNDAEAILRQNMLEDGYSGTSLGFYLVFFGGVFLFAKILELGLGWPLLIIAIILAIPFFLIKYHFYLAGFIYIVAFYLLAKFFISKSVEKNKKKQEVDGDQVDQFRKNNSTDTSQGISLRKTTKKVIRSISSDSQGNGNNIQRNFRVNEKVVPKGAATPPNKVTLGSLTESSSYKYTIRGNVKVSERASPKGLPTRPVPKEVVEPIGNTYLESTTLSKLPKTLNTLEEEKATFGPIKCPGCQSENKRYKLLISDVGSGWKKCPLCNMNFQI